VSLPKSTVAKFRNTRTIAHHTPPQFTVRGGIAGVPGTEWDWDDKTYEKANGNGNTLADPEIPWVYSD